MIDDLNETNLMLNDCVLLRRRGPDRWVLAIQALDSLTGTADQESWQTLKDFRAEDDRPVFGHISYDMKNAFERLDSNNVHGMATPAFFFFKPSTVYIMEGDEIEMKFWREVSDEDVEVLVNGFFSEGALPKKHPKTKLKARTSKERYINEVNALQEHIAQGNIYEVNYCMEFYAEGVDCQPFQIFKKLNELTDAPHACYYKFDEFHVLCASPERFLRHADGQVISEPMKGTIRRGSTEREDEALKEQLRNDAKERSENVMIVDLVRNDLSKHAKKGSVTVEELCGIQTFKTVHQMVSKISAEVPEGTSPEDLIEAAFPMGSMTGAPKVRAMELIEAHEDMQRGIYSGCIGHITPEGEFDFNVVIRTIEYNEHTGYLSLKVGSAITAASDPEMEYDECLLKAEALMKALE